MALTSSYDEETIDSRKADKGTSLVFIYFHKENFINIKALFMKRQAVCPERFEARVTIFKVLLPVKDINLKFLDKISLTNEHLLFISLFCPIIWVIM